MPLDIDNTGLPITACSSRYKRWPKNTRESLNTERLNNDSWKSELTCICRSIRIWTLTHKMAYNTRGEPPPFCMHLLAPLNTSAVNAGFVGSPDTGSGGWLMVVKGFTLDTTGLLLLLYRLLDTTCTDGAGRDFTSRVGVSWRWCGVVASTSCFMLFFYLSSLTAATSCSSLTRGVRSTCRRVAASRAVLGPVMPYQGNPLR